jgi:hypothetical protein
VFVTGQLKARVPGTSCMDTAVMHDIPMVHTRGVSYKRGSLLYTIYTPLGTYVNGQTKRINVSAYTKCTSGGPITVCKRLHRHCTAAAQTTCTAPLPQCNKPCRLWTHQVSSMGIVAPNHATATPPLPLYNCSPGAACGPRSSSNIV